MDAKAKLNFIKTKARKAFLNCKRKWLRKKNQFQIQYSQALGRELPKDLQQNHKAIQRALDGYSPKPYAGKLTIFRASSQPRGIVPDPFLGWRELAIGAIEVLESPGTHGAMTVDPYAQDLARHLLLLLPVAARADARSQPIVHRSPERPGVGETLVQPHA